MADQRLAVEAVGAGAGGDGGIRSPGRGCLRAVRSARGPLGGRWRRPCVPAADAGALLHGQRAGKSLDCQSSDWSIEGRVYVAPLGKTNCYLRTLAQELETWRGKR